MAELTRGQRAAQTRKKNAAKRKAEQEAAEAATAMVSDNKVVAPQGVTAAFLTGFFQSLHQDFAGLTENLRSAVYAVRDDETGITVQATWDGEHWRIAFV